MRLSTSRRSNRNCSLSGHEEDLRSEFAICCNGGLSFQRRQAKLVGQRDFIDDSDKKGFLLTADQRRCTILIESSAEQSAHFHGQFWASQVASDEINSRP